MPAGVVGFISFHIERSEIFHNAEHYFTFCEAKYFTFVTVQFLSAKQPKYLFYSPFTKIRELALGFFICVRRTQHRLLGYAEKLHLWATPTTSLSAVRTQMNDVALRANEVLRNEVLASLEMMLRLRRKRN